MRRSRLASFVGLFLVVAAACDQQEADTRAEQTLSQAVERTLAADSFHIDAVQTYEGKDHEGEVDYVAPDRVRLTFPPSEESIFIGRDMYFSQLEQPDRFVWSESPCETTVDLAVAALAFVQEVDEVRLVGDTYVFSTAGEPAVSGEAHIEDGLLKSLLVRYEIPGDVDEQVVERHTFTRFGDDISIEAPPPEQVTRESGSMGAAPGVIVVDEGSPVTCQ
jgi:hypothetical protein